MADLGQTRGFLVARVVLVVMLLGALGDRSFGYYILLRWAVCAVMAYGAWLLSRINKNNWTWVFAVIALLFNPFIPARLGRDMWPLVDLGLAIFLFVSLFLLKVHDREAPKKEAHNLNIQQGIKRILLALTVLYIVIALPSILVTFYENSKERVAQSKFKTYCKSEIVTIEAELKRRGLKANTNSDFRLSPAEEQRKQELEDSIVKDMQDETGFWETMRGITLKEWGVVFLVMLTGPCVIWGTFFTILWIARGFKENSSFLQD